MQIRVPQSERGKYNPGISDERAGGPLSREDLIGLGKSMLVLAQRIEVVGLAQGTLTVVDGLRREVNRFCEWNGYRAKDISRWNQDVRDVLLQLGRILAWCYPTNSGKHSPDENAKELRTLGDYAFGLADGKREVWSRVMSRRDIADRVLKSPDKWRTLLKVYGERLKQIGGKGSRNWQMRLDGLPENLVKEMNRP